MNWMRSRETTATIPSAFEGNDPFRVRALIDEATSDSYDENDEHAGLMGMVRDELECPFRARVGGEEVQCVRIEGPRSGFGLNVVCQSRRGKTRVVDISQLEYRHPLPRGYQWIQAYLTWRDMLA